MAAGLGWAAASGLIFGSINVAVKKVGIDPLLQSALAYLGVAAVLAPFLRGLSVRREDRLRMAAMALVGGAVAPVLLFYGLQQTSAIDSGLLLTLELVVTAVLAVLFLKERERLAGWVGLGLLLSAALAAAMAGYSSGATTPMGAALVALAAAGWGLDNMLSTRLVGSYRPTQILAVKGLVGGGTTLAVALLLARDWPGPSGVATAGAIGVFGLAGSLICFYQALQRVGAARTSAINIPMTALAGALGGFLVLEEALTPVHAVALALLVGGVVLLLAPGKPPRTATLEQPPGRPPQGSSMTPE